METLTIPKEAKAFDINRIRRDFPLLQGQMRGKPIAYLDNAASSQKPQIVLDALVRGIYIPHTFHQSQCKHH